MSTGNLSGGSEWGGRRRKKGGQQAAEGGSGKGSGKKKVSIKDQGLRGLIETLSKLVLKTAGKRGTFISEPENERRTDCIASPLSVRSSSTEEFDSRVGSEAITPASAKKRTHSAMPVPYTHLTLPTSYSV